MKGNISITVIILIIIGLVVLGVIVYAAAKTVAPIPDLGCNEENGYCGNTEPVKTQANYINNYYKEWRLPIDA